VGALAPDELLRMPQGEPSGAIAARVRDAMQRQLARQGCPNAALSGAALDSHCALDDAAAQWLTDALRRLGWSARAAHRTLKVGRTIADLAGQDNIALAHLAEAVQYRRVISG
ncbi:MAG: ATP-dependent protease, partial [Thiomonas sp. 14-66-4]